MFMRVPRVDDLHHTDEGEAGAPGSAVPAGGGDSRRGADARRREFARVPHAEWEADLGVDAAQDAPAPDRGCGARLPPVVPGLAAEETDRPREVIEAALAHVIQNKVEATYARSDLFERRASASAHGRLGVGA